jgi:hypothetical protein
VHTCCISRRSTTLTCNCSASCSPNASGPCWGDASEKRPRPEADARDPAARPGAEGAADAAGHRGTLTPLVDESEDAEEITVVERRFVLVRHR